MKLKISSFADVGQPEKERLIIRAESDADVGEYLVMATSISTDGNATAGFKLAYWFPDKEVKAGDLVVLYSKSGKQSEKQLTSGVTAHFFYWGLQKLPVWSSAKGAVLLLAAEWQFEPGGEK